MAEVVDSIIAELIVRDNGYAAGMQAATKAADAQAASLRRLAAAHKLADEMMTNRSARGTPGSAAAKEANAAVAEVKKAAKAKTDAEKAAARETAEAVKASEREKAAAAQATAREAEKLNRQAVRAAEQRANAEREASAKVIAAAEREAAARARLSEVTQRAVDRAAERDAATAERAAARVAARVQNGPASSPIASGGAPAGRVSFPSAVLTTSGATNAEVEREINHLLADDLSLRARSIGATGADANALRDQRAELQLIAGYKRAGLTDDQAALRIEADLAAIARNRAVEVERVAAAERAAALAAEKAAAATAAAAERQVRSQTDKTATHLSLLAPTLAGGITAHELSALNDEYIKLSNSLKVAGVSAAELDQVQGHLLATANRTGTDINALADLYRSAALASHDLGASQQDLLKVSDAVANALRIGGRSSEEARGAILQLGHAFESGRVTAREFNSLALNLYPVLQAVAKGSDQFGGSVAKLRQALLDGDITSKVFFQDLLHGSDDLAKRAAAATLTTAQGFTALRNSLIVYFGEADKAQGVSAALGAALRVLADNLDTLIPAIVAIGTALTVGYVVRAASAAIATKNLGSAILTAFGNPVGLAITAVVLALGSFAVEANKTSLAVQQANEQYSELHDRLTATSTQARLAAGGVAGVGSDALGAIPKVNAFAGAVGNLAQQLYNQARAARAARVESLQQQLHEGQTREAVLAGATSSGRNASVSDLHRGDFLGNASVIGRAATGSLRNVLSGGRTDREAADAYAKQIALNRDIQQQITAARTAPISVADIPGGAPSSGGISAKAQKQVDKLKGDVAGLEQLAGGATGARLDRIKKQIDIRNRKIADIEQGVTSGAANAAEGGGAGRARRGPSADTLARRAEAARKRGVRDDSAYDAELRKAESDYLSETADLANDAAARADIERKRVVFQAGQFAKEIAAKGPAKDGGTGQFTASEVTNLQRLNSLTADVRVSSIDTSERRRIAADALSLDKAGRDAQRELLQQQSQLADTVADRRRIALQLLDLDYQQRAADLKAVNAPDSTAMPTEKKIAADKLKALPGQKAADEKIAGKQNQSAGQSYLEGLSPDRGEFIQSEEIKGLQDFNKGLDDSVSKALHLHGIFGDILGDLIDMAIKQALIKPLAGALFGGGQAGGSSGGGIGGLFGSILSAIGGKGGGDPAASIGAGADDFGFSGIPGFANGGSATIGGNPGIDQNVLSINGKPSLRVGSGEQLSITPPGGVNQRVQPGGGNSTIVQHLHIDASNSVNPDGFEDRILSKANGYARQAAMRSGQAAVNAAPARVRSVQVLGS